MLFPSDHYLRERLLGQGGEAEAWLAWPTGSPSTRPGPVVLTCLARPADQVATALAPLAAIDHPGIAPILDVTAEPTGAGIVTPYYPGGTLRGLLDDRGTLTRGALVPLLVSLAESLGVLHRHGLVHGDLHPDNVVLAGDGSPVLIDVGRGSWPGRPLAANPSYLDPHVLDLGRPDPAADRYSLGVLAYEALSGRLPHRGSPPEALAAARSGAHRPLGSWPGVDARLAAVVEESIATRRQDRCPSLASWVAKLVGVSSLAGTTATGSDERIGLLPPPSNATARLVGVADRTVELLPLVDRSHTTPPRATRRRRRFRPRT